MKEHDEPVWSRAVRLHAEGELGFAAAGAAGNWIAAFAARTGLSGLRLNRLRFIDWHHRSLETAPVIVDGLLELYPQIRRAIDLGCGTGACVHELRRRGVAVVGYEHTRHARRVAGRVFGLDLRPFDIGRFAGTGARYDLCLCVEVGHYLPSELALRLVAHCAAAAPLVAFSAAALNRGDDPRAPWLDRFAAHGMRLCPEHTVLERYLRARLRRNRWLADHICLFASA